MNKNKIKELQAELLDAKNKRDAAGNEGDEDMYQYWSREHSRILRLLGDERAKE